MLPSATKSTGLDEVLDLLKSHELGGSGISVFVGVHGHFASDVRPRLLELLLKVLGHLDVDLQRLIPRILFELHLF